MNEPSAQTISHYRLLSRLGAGGMGEVYLAEDLTLDRQVAIKLMPADVVGDPDRKRRFIREAKAASALNHPNICVIHEVGETETGQLFIVMEHVEGETLQARIGQQPLNTGELVTIGLQAADAIEAAHARGITHRDLKPANLMVTPRGQVKVLDFGLAKVTITSAETAHSDPATASTTDPSIVMGTVQYMSPEQALGRDVDPRSDVFSLGVVLYQMATGRLPFAGASATETIDRITHAQPEAIGRFNYELPADLERIVRKCLEKDRERRYQSARELRIDLQNLQRDSAAGGVPGEDAKARRQEARRRWAITALVVAVLAAAGAGLYVVGRWGRDQAIDSVAVLPFANQSRDPDAEYLSDGLAESIINNLTTIPDLRVIARTSAFRYKGKENDPFRAGAELDVRAVVTGRVLQRGETLDVSAELVDVRDNKQIWGQQYTRKLADVFVVQQEIAKEISEQLRVKLSGAERQQIAKLATENLKAFQYYTKARDFTQRRTREDLQTAIRYCEQALDEDPNYALAYSVMADAYQALAVRGYISPRDGLLRTEEFARKALALDEDLAEAHAALGAVYNASVPANFALGDRELRQALALKPGLAAARFYLGISLSRQGRLDEALQESTKAHQDDPFSSINARNVALVHYLKRDFPTAIRLLRKADELGPPFSATWEVGVYVQNGLFDEALSALKEASSDRKNDPILIHSTGVVAAARGNRSEALAIVRELEQMSGNGVNQSQWIARIYSTLNENERALQWLERGADAGAIGAFYPDDALWDPLRRDRRFEELVRRLGIPKAERPSPSG